MESFVGRIVDAPSEPFVTAYVPSGNPANVTVSYLRTDGFDLVGTASDRSGIVLIEPRRARSRKRPMHSTTRQVHAPTAAADPMEVARARYASLRAEIVDRSLSLRAAAARMDLSPQGLSDRIERGQMLAFPDKNRKMIPVELIDLERPDRTVPGLGEVIRAASVEPFRLAVWLLSASRALGGKRPVDELRRGRIASVVDAAYGLDA
ncbi:MAG TPA: hypothetical protein VFB22_14565 [Candidatus Baltobacteraceae bacterium]|nr:hypothetical protein [Candidatus Baltobacteraceae bacterium]